MQKKKNKKVEKALETGERVKEFGGEKKEKKRKRSQNLQIQVLQNQRRQQTQQQPASQTPLLLLSRCCCSWALIQERKICKMRLRPTAETGGPRGLCCVGLATAEKGKEKEKKKKQRTISASWPRPACCGSCCGCCCCSGRSPEG